MFRRNLLRIRDARHEERVGPVELFFDLVFVFAVTQLSHVIIQHPDATGFLQAAILFAAIWWVWVSTAWVTNWLDVGHMPVRLLLFFLMGPALLMSISLPEAFGERGMVFVVALVTVALSRCLFMLLALARHNRDNFINFVRITLWALFEAGFWIAGGLAHETGARTALWGVAVAILFAGPALRYWLPGLGATDTRVWDVEGHHFSERCGLFIIIALGESILVTGATFGETAWNGASIAAFASAFAGALAMWWLYFDMGADRAARRLVENDDPGRMARLAYTYFHIPIVAGIIVTAASDEMAIVHPSHHPGPAEIACLLGGPALYLLGNLLFKRTNASRVPLSHLVGLAILAAILPFAARLTPLLLSLASTATLILVAFWEMRSFRGSRAASGS
ncbi:MAG TPA: low temperature requirement protein A [Allosphingosinicella sp.]|nr:low temperature requirement protein A [Allosphingosinicella sp.]